MFYISIPPFDVQLETDIPAVINSINHMYQYALKPVEDTEKFSDFHIRIASPSSIRKYYRPQVQFYIDGKTPFKPLPLSQAFPFFEWGLNWCIASHTYQYLLLHAAVVEKGNQALILPGYPGAGKSTLCAALVSSGWRLLSDEMAVIDTKTLELIPVVRPISLKNESINVISESFSNAEFGESFLDTAKGTVSHMKPPKQSFIQRNQRVQLKWVVFPRYLATQSTLLTEKEKGETLIELAENSFNYNVLGSQGFNVLCDLVASARCYKFEYSCLDEAIDLFQTLANEQ